MSMPPTPPSTPPIPLAMHTPGYEGLWQDDRSSRLVGIGIVLILIGSLAGCCAVLMPVSLILVNNASPEIQKTLQHNYVLPLLSAAVIYSLACAMFTTLGIGAIRKRRWSRPLTLILSAHWLASGIACCLFLPPMMYIQTMAQKAVVINPAGVPPMVVVIGFTLLIEILFGVVLPCVILYLLKDEKVKVTLEYFDPIVCWTDKCPLRVLGLTMTLWVFAVFSIMAVLQKSMVFFGLILPWYSSLPIIVIMSIGMAYAGWRIYQMKKIGYQLGGGLICLISLSMLISPLMLDIPTYYSSLGLGKEMIDVYLQYPTLTKFGVLGIPTLLSLSVLIYLWQVWSAYRNEIT